MPYLALSKITARKETRFQPSCWRTAVRRISLPSRDGGEDRFAQIPNGAREDAGVAGASAQHERSLDANHQIFSTEPRRGAREAGLDAERFDRIDPAAEGAAQGTSKAGYIHAPRQPLEQARLLAAFVEAIESIEHAIEFLFRCSRGPHGLEERLLELIFEARQHLQRHFLFAVWKVVIQARFAETGRFGNVRHRCAVESLFAKEIHQAIQHVRLAQQARRHVTTLT